MTTFPYAIDNDASIIRIDDNLSQLGSTAINQLRDAVFAIEQSIGLNPGGTLASIADRISVSLNPNGTIKASALTSVGLATLPITDVQVATNAGIQESKLNLNHTTTNLYTRIVTDENTLNSLAAFTTAINSDLHVHVTGGAVLSDNSLARHVVSQIDLNAVPFDSRDPAYIWTGLLDKNGVQRSATTSAEALLQINNDLTGHENATAGAHVATAVSVDVSNFTEIPLSANTVQKALDAIDDMETLSIGEHRQNMHANGVPATARSSQFGDGYGQNIVPLTACETYLVHAPATYPVDDNVVGDDVVKFVPANINYAFDSQFTQVRVGDIITINYANGITAQYPVESIRYAPGSQWFVRLNGVNLFDTADGYARIDRPLFEDNTYGVLACASANNDIYTNILSSVVVGNPRGATALGLGFDPEKLDSGHYNLYLALYPTGNPVDYIINIPAIDVTGNKGITPGKYTIDTVVAATNDQLRAAGYNCRFIAFSHKGEFGIMLADVINNAAFSIIDGEVSGASLIPGGYTNNVIDDIADGYLDAFGFGILGTGIASPAYTGSFTTASAAYSFPTKVIVPRKNRNYVVNGVRRDTFAPTLMAIGDGYWPATITVRSVLGPTVEVTYQVDMLLEDVGLLPGKTLVVQPDFAITDPRYQTVDYGRFIIKSVSFTPACWPVPAYTTITVVSGIHATGISLSPSSLPGLVVRLYFGEDSVGFNELNLVDEIPGVATYLRYHEIYVTDAGNTFSHERARMIKQTASSVNLDTSGTPSPWTITDVSPKLRGFGSPTDPRRYVTFIVLRYDATSGEFDGYIGSPFGDGFGIVTTVRKNTRARFYDITNVDYVELMYTELDTISSDVAPPGNNPRSVLVEIFQPLATDDEMFLLAGCQIDDKDVTFVEDRREFGNVSEKNFTLSAISFIESGERYLHANGVIRGMDYIGVDPYDSATFMFKGGIVLVNGHFCAMNDAKVRIPEIRDSAPPDNVTCAICVNDNGELEPIILTTSKSQFFTANIAPAYYVPSVTFPELIATRKDLLPIYIVTNIINSFTPGTPIDARRYIVDETLNIPFSITDSTLLYGKGNFNTFEQLKTWYSFYNADVGKSTIDIRGSIEIDSENLASGYYGMTLQGGNVAELIIDSGLIISNITLKDLFIYLSPGAMLDLYNGVILDNCIIVVQGDSGVFVVGDSVTIKNCQFFYIPVSPLTAGDYIGTGNAAIYCLAGSGTTRSGLIIDNCKFESFNAASRPPFIGIEVAKGGEFVNSIISNNTFFDDTATQYAAIAIVGVTSGSSVAPLVADVRIDNNVCVNFQSIYLTSVAYSYQPIAVNCQITRNHCAGIGYNTQANTGLATTTLANYKSPGSLLIDGNACWAIGAVLADVTNAVPTATSLTYSTGMVIISDNFTRGMKLPYYAANTKNSSLLVSGNIVEAGDMSLVAPAFQYSDGIDVYTAVSEGDGYSCIVSNNIVRQGHNSAFFGYGILVLKCHADIINNTISGFSGVGISAQNASIQSNHISRGTTVISNYIWLNGPGIIVDNWLDSSTVDNVNNWQDAIISITTAGLVDRNKNHATSKQIIPIARGIITSDANAVFTSTSGPVVSAYGFIYVASVAYTAGAPGTCTWAIPLPDYLPSGVCQINSISVDVELTNATVPINGGSVDLDIFAGDFLVSPLPVFNSQFHNTIDVATALPHLGDTATITLPPSIAPGVPTVTLPPSICASQDYYMRLKCVNLTDGNSFTLNISAITIEYQY
jgi:hypothetical protein